MSEDIHESKQTFLALQEQVDTRLWSTPQGAECFGVFLCQAFVRQIIRSTEKPTLRTEHAGLAIMKL
jgi:hypothetical protein